MYLFVSKLLAGLICDTNYRVLGLTIKETMFIRV